MINNCIVRASCYILGLITYYFITLQDFPWYVNRLAKHTVTGINETASLVWFVPSSSVDRAKAVLHPVAREYFSENAEETMYSNLLFFVAKGGDDAAEALRKFAKLPKAEPLLVIVNLLTNQVSI